jgi:uncharacterized membrane protein YfcA
MNTNKLFLTTIGIAIYLYVLVLLFNHVQVWIAIAGFVLGVYIAVKLLTKKQQNEEQ